MKESRLLILRRLRSSRSCDTETLRFLCPRLDSGKSKRGLSKGGLARKGPIGPKRALPFGAISALPPWLWGAEELVPIGPEKAPTSPEMAPILPRKGPIFQEGFPPDFL